jgi:hypothetical protein
MHWILSGYQQDYAAPGGSLVFELRQNSTTQDYIVRVYYTQPGRRQSGRQLHDLRDAAL